MSANHFNKAFTFVTSPEIEGAFVNDPDDRGGKTNRGISQKSYPDLDIEKLTLERTRSIFKKDYWDEARCGELPGKWAFALFDAAVIHGPDRAVMLMQQALRVKPDGINGPITQSATRNAGDYFFALFFTIRARFCFDITLADSSQVKFLNGWLNRLFLLKTAICRNEGDLRD
ncbi:MAG: glycosyl hydrolase 108 family protein [Candidatus Thiodiazotropha endolucinida]